LIDVAMPSDRNVIETYSKMKLKYKNISVRIQLMWNMKCFVCKGLKICGNNTYIKKPYWEHGTS
jgi:hypothetical protein